MELFTQCARLGRKHNTKRGLGRGETLPELSSRAGCAGGRRAVRSDALGRAGALWVERAGPYWASSITSR